MEEKSSVRSSSEPMCHFTSRALGSRVLRDSIWAHGAPKGIAWMVGPRGFFCH